jgi:hypothetical protein
VSTILKALQRLEDEKSADAERSLDEQVVARRPPPAPERRGLKIGAVVIGGLAVAAVAFLFWLTREEPDAEVAMESPPPAAAPEAAGTTKVAAEKPRRRPSARPAPAAREQRDSSDVEVSSVVEVVKLLDAPPADSTEPAAVPAAAPNRTARAAKAGTERPARRRRGTRKPESQAARGSAEPIPAPKQVADAKPPVTEISEKPAPAKPAPAPPAPVEVAVVAAKPAPTAVSASIPAPIREPEQKVVQRAKLPELSIEKTIWHPDADRRVAIVKLIDAEEVLHLKEGDAIGPLVVKTINPGSVLFNHDSIEIRYNVGS